MSSRKTICKDLVCQLAIDIIALIGTYLQWNGNEFLLMIAFVCVTILTIYVSIKYPHYQTEERLGWFRTLAVIVQMIGFLQIFDESALNNVCYFVP